MEPIAEPLPKPVIRNVEDLKALEGDWEHSWGSKAAWCKFKHYSDVELLCRLGYEDLEIRQISLPSNGFLVSECIEPEIEVGEIMEESNMLGYYKVGFSDAQLEQISQIIDDKLKERGMLEGE